MAKGPNAKVFMVLTGVAVLAGGGLGYFQYSNFADVKASVSKLRSEAKDEKTVRSDLEVARQEFQGTASKLTHLEVGVSDVAYVPTMLKELEKTGKEAGMTVLGVRPIAEAQKSTMQREKAKKETETPKKKAYTELNIEVKCRGRYRSVMNFLSKLGSFPKVVAAKTVSLQPKSSRLDDVGTPDLDATIVLTSYVFGEPKKKAGDSEVSGEKTIDLSASKRMMVQ